MNQYTDPITILIPSWKRRKFLPLIIANLKQQNYPHHLLSVIIDDDGIENDDDILIRDYELEEIKKHLEPIKLQYNKSTTRKTIGAKRNQLIKQCQTKIFAFIDSDDIYFPTYLTHSIDVMKRRKVGCVGSDKMIFCMTDRNFDVHAIDCGDNELQIHEASIVATKKWYKATAGFANSSAGEGVNLFTGMSKKSIGITDISQIMCCVQHSENTIDKLRFAEEKNKLTIKLDENMIKLLQVILSYDGQ
jgi:hypothetical protein